MSHRALGGSLRPLRLAAGVSIGQNREHAVPLARSREWARDRGGDRLARPTDPGQLTYQERLKCEHKEIEKRKEKQKYDLVERHTKDELTNSPVAGGG